MTDTFYCAARYDSQVAPYETYIDAESFMESLIMFTRHLDSLEGDYDWEVIKIEKAFSIRRNIHDRTFLL